MKKLNIVAAEDWCRKLIGTPIPPSFTKLFEEKLTDNEVKKLMSVVGKTEWVLVSERFVNEVQSEFRSNWTKSELPVRLTPYERLIGRQIPELHIPDGENFCKQLFRIGLEHCKTQPQLTATGNRVQVTFEPTRFSFTFG